MKKTIFKGTINGKEFNSVQEYNKAMTQALTMGESVNAKAETKTVDDDDELCCNCNGCNCCECEKEVAEDREDLAQIYTPLVLTDGVNQPKIVLDDFIDYTQEKRTWEEGKKELIDHLKQCLKSLSPALENWKEEDYKNYLNEICVILEEFKRHYNSHVIKLSEIEKKQKEYSDKIDQLEDFLDELDKKAEVVKNGMQFYDIVESYYKDLKKKIFKKLERITPITQERPISQQPIKTSVKETSKQEEYNFEGLLNKVFDLLTKTLSDTDNKK